MCDVRVIQMQTQMAHEHHPTRNRCRNEEKQLSNKSSDVKFEACSTDCTNVINSKLCAGGEYECRYDTTVSQSTAHCTIQAKLWNNWCKVSQSNDRKTNGTSAVFFPYFNCCCSWWWCCCSSADLYVRMPLNMHEGNSSPTYILY